MAVCMTSFRCLDTSAAALAALPHASGSSSSVCSEKGFFARKQLLGNAVEGWQPQARQRKRSQWRLCIAALADRVGRLEESSPTTGTDAFNAAVPEGSKLSLGAIVAPVSSEIDEMHENLKSVVGSRHPMLMAAAEQIFGAGGKRMRPAIVFLVSRATASFMGLKELRSQHKRLAEITEMIHTASLVHDDVLDDSDTRRGATTVHQLYGTRVAVLAGDFLFAQSSWYLANLDNLEVIKLISQVIADFANGEISQAASLFDCDLTIQQYLDKSFFKTASLIAASAKSAAVFSEVPPAVADQMFEYGKHLGLAFQVVDDILDFTQDSETLGKPAGSDLASGNLTAPALFALQVEPRLREIVEGEFADEGSLEEAIEIVKRVGGIEKAKALARQEGDAARKCLECLPYSETRRSLEGMVDYVLERLY
eukprot:jgi/Mesvir1/4422/Mv11916-RA.1